jgi:adenine-specific DNA-methyltransferase
LAFEEVMARQYDLIDTSSNEAIKENGDFLSKQLITYIGNKRSLLDFIGNGVDIVIKKLNKKKLDIIDVFSGSGVVSRYFKQYARKLYALDLEKYSEVINLCYLSNQSEVDSSLLKDTYNEVLYKLVNEPLDSGFITELYSPRNDKSIKKGERVFYTSRNAQYLDTARKYIESIDLKQKKYLLAPLLSEASIHANTSGVFKGFYKNSEKGIGQFGGNNQDALFRILGNIEIPFPVFSNFECEYTVFRGDSNQTVQNISEVDIAYLDPPYNQHPYGSNYFMLNLIVDYQKPINTSTISGIPDDWNRSEYNRSAHAFSQLKDIVDKIKAKYLLISFNSEGFITVEEMVEMLKKQGKLSVLETKYNTFRGSRNLNNREIHVKEYLYLLEKK